MKTLFLFLLFGVCYCYHVSGQTNEPAPPPPMIDPPPPPPMKDSPMFNEKAQAFAYVEKMPEFKGGQAEMYRFIGANIYMPDTCKEMGVAGTVAVRFVVDSMGYVRDAEVVRNTTVDCGYGAVALEMLEKMNHPEPHWTPGRHEGKVVNVAFTLPVKFAFSN